MGGNSIQIPSDLQQQYNQYETETCFIPLSNPPYQKALRLGKSADVSLQEGEYRAYARATAGWAYRRGFVELLGSIAEAPLSGYWYHYGDCRQQACERLRTETGDTGIVCSDKLIFSSQVYMGSDANPIIAHEEEFTVSEVTDTAPPKETDSPE